MRNTWLAGELAKISNPQNEFAIQQAIDYIQQLEDDNESLQVALEGNIWSPKLWDQQLTADESPKNSN